MEENVTREFLMEVLDLKNVLSLEKNILAWAMCLVRMEQNCSS